MPSPGSAESSSLGVSPRLKPGSLSEACCNQVTSVAIRAGRSEVLDRSTGSAIITTSMPRDFKSSSFDVSMTLPSADRPSWLWPSTTGVEAVAAGTDASMTATMACTRCRIITSCHPRYTVPGSR